MFHSIQFFWECITYIYIGIICSNLYLHKRRTSKFKLNYLSLLPTSPADVCSKQFKFMSLNLINLTFQNLLKDYEFYIEKQTLSRFTGFV